MLKKESMVPLILFVKQHGFQLFTFLLAMVALIMAIVTTTRVSALKTGVRLALAEPDPDKRATLLQQGGEGGSS